MSKINLLTLQPGDSQSTFIDKINYNYDQILTAGGGPQGIPGRKGETGPIGPQGVQGVQGSQGLQGTKWYVEPSASGGFGPTAGNSLGIPVSGDYWLNSDNREIFIYGVTGSSMDWLDSGYNLRSEQIFGRVSSNYNSGTTSYDSDVVYYSENDTDKFSFLLSDWGTDSGSTNYVGSTGYGLNSEKSKLKIATAISTNYQNLISFGRADFDSQNSTSSSFSNTHNPVIKWTEAGTTASSPTSSGIWDVDFYNPIGDWNFRTTGGKTLISSKDLNRIVTSDIAGGTLVSFSSNGFFQVASGGSGYMPNPYFSVTSTGVGVKTNPVANSFSVKGSSSFSNSDSFNSYTFPSGSIGVENAISVGSTGPFGNNLVVKGSSSVASSNLYNSYSFPIGFMGIENGLNVGGTVFNPLNIPVDLVGYGTGSNQPKVQFSGQGNGSVFQSRLDAPGATSNAMLSWGDSTIFPYSGNSIPNNLVQEYATDGSLPATGFAFASYYQSAGGSGYATSPSGPAQFSIISKFASDTTISTLNQSSVLNLQAYTGSSNARVRIGGNNIPTLRVFSNSVRIGAGPESTASHDLPVDGSVTRTILSVEDDASGRGIGMGSYFGPRPSQLAWSLPNNLSNWPTGCLTTPSPFGSISRVKVVGDNNPDGINGINLARETDSTPTGPTPPDIACSIGSSKGRAKALTVTDYDYYTHAGHTYGTLTWDGKLTLGLRATLSSTGAITNTSYASIFTTYGGPSIIPDNASIFTYGNVGVQGNIVTNGDMHIDADLYVTGNITAGGTITPSSRILKENIEPLKLGSDVISKLNPVSFTWKKDNKQDIGFIAEELFEIIPEVTATNAEGTITGYDPTRIIPILTKTIQELMEKLRILKEEVEILKSK